MPSWIIASPSMMAERQRSGANYPEITITPVMAVAREHPHFAIIDHNERTIAIMFDFMNPVPPVRWLIGRGGNLRLDETE